MVVEFFSFLLCEMFPPKLKMVIVGPKIVEMVSVNVII